MGHELPDDALMGLMAMAPDFEFEVAPLKRASARAMEAVIAVRKAARMLALATDLNSKDLRKSVMDLNTIAVMDTVGF